MIRAVIAPFRSCERDDRFSLGDRRTILCRRHEIEPDAVAFELLGNRAGDGHGVPTLGGDDDHRRETGLEPLDRAGVSGPVGDVLTHAPHGVHAVRDDVRESDRLRELLVLVDRVPVTGRVGVPDEILPYDFVGPGGKLLALREVPSSDARAHGSALLRRGAALDDRRTSDGYLLVVGCWYEGFGD